MPMIIFTNDMLQIIILGCGVCGFAFAVFYHLLELQAADRGKRRQRVDDEHVTSLNSVLEQRRRDAARAARASERRVSRLLLSMAARLEKTTRNVNVVDSDSSSEEGDETSSSQDTLVDDPPKRPRVPRRGAKAAGVDDKRAGRSPTQEGKGPATLPRVRKPMSPLRQRPSMPRQRSPQE